MNKKILEINNLSKHFENNGSKISVLNNINLKIETGKVIAIIGPSGSGKSTFLHLISLLDIPSKGKIKILGKSITDLSDNEKKQCNVAATLLKIKERKTSKGNPYAILKLTDLKSVFELLKKQINMFQNYKKC